MCQGLVIPTLATMAHVVKVQMGVLTVNAIQAIVVHSAKKSAVHVGFGRAPTEERVFQKGRSVSAYALHPTRNPTVMLLCLICVTQILANMKESASFYRKKMITSVIVLGTSVERIAQNVRAQERRSCKT